MTHLVTGCAGFIGSYVTAELLAQGRHVVGVDNLNNAYDPVLKNWRLKQLQAEPGFTFHRQDITDRQAMAELFAANTFETVINLAARAGVRQSTQDPWIYVETNVTGSLNLLDLSRRHDVGTCLLASTSSLYGEDNPVPFRETAKTERPLSPYAASKKGLEAMAATYSHLYGIDTPVPRYFTVYGPAGRPGMSVFRFVRWVAEGEPVTVYGDGSQRRDFTYVDDIAHGTIAAAEKVDGFEIINLGNDSPIELTGLIETIEDAVGKGAELVHKDRHPADVDATWANIDKARKLLGWEPQVDLEEGIRRTVAWYMDEREWASKVDLGGV